MELATTIELREQALKDTLENMGTEEPYEGTPFDYDGKVEVGYWPKPKSTAEGYFPLQDYGLGMESYVKVLDKLCYTLSIYSVLAVGLIVFLT
jgi:hypothetical protein